jgi:hypothetical protein
MYTKTLIIVLTLSISSILVTAEALAKDEEDASYCIKKRAGTGEYSKTTEIANSCDRVVNFGAYSEGPDLTGGEYPSSPVFHPGLQPHGDFTKRYSGKNVHWGACFAPYFPASIPGTKFKGFRCFLREELPARWWL